MYQALQSTKATVSESTQPESLVIHLNGQTSTSMPPTHMAAIYSSAPSGPEPRCVMMYRIHQSIHSLYCANLPVLAESTPSPTNSKSSFEVPVVPLTLSNPDSFPFLIQFLYLKDGHTLFENFLSLVLSIPHPHKLPICQHQRHPHPPLHHQHQRQRHQYPPPCLTAHPTISSTQQCAAPLAHARPCSYHQPHCFSPTTCPSNVTSTG